MTQQPIGVMGCLPSLPPEFPVSMPENAGNMVHGNAPFELYPHALFYQDPRFGPGRGNFIDFLNGECSHLIVTVANFFKLNGDDGLRYERFRSFLSKVDVPIVVFGLGAQAPTRDVEGTLPREAIDLMKFLGDRTELVGVRGQFTADLFEHFAGVRNTFVTGCPSFFSRPQAFDTLAESLEQGRTGRVAYNGTTYHEPEENQMLVRAIQEDCHLVEPVNKFAAMYSIALQRGDGTPVFPWFLKTAVKDGRLSQSQVAAYYSTRFRLFRDTAAWYAFNAESVGFTYGTRFHVNMASVLSGVPALWVTHDSRTEELTEVLRVPAVRKEHVVGLSPHEVRVLADYRPMFSALGGLFERFNFYLRAHGLPPVDPPKSSAVPGSDVPREEL